MTRHPRPTTVQDATNSAGADPGAISLAWFEPGRDQGGHHCRHPQGRATRRSSTTRPRQGGADLVDERPPWWSRRLGRPVSGRISSRHVIPAAGARALARNSCG